MGQLITPTKVVTVTKDGECHLTITLELNINLNSLGDGGEKVSASLRSADKMEVEDDNVDFMIPDFSSGQSLKFGKGD